MRDILRAQKREKSRTEGEIRRKANRSYYSNKYRAVKLKAMPAWYNDEAVQKIYLLCSLISAQTGVKHQVDHIVPLLGRNVCGLHVQDNLSIIPASENFRKSNVLPGEENCSRRSWTYGELVAARKDRVERSKEIPSMFRALGRGSRHNLV